MYTSVTLSPPRSPYRRARVVRSAPSSSTSERYGRPARTSTIGQDGSMATGKLRQVTWGVAAGGGVTFLAMALTFAAGRGGGAALAPPARQLRPRPPLA